MAKKLNASNAWIFPALCWMLSGTITLAHLNFSGIVNLFLALGELALLIAAIYIGVIVLINKKGDYSPREKIHAIAGLVIVGLTFVMIILAIVS